MLIETISIIVLSIAIGVLASSIYFDNLMKKDFHLEATCFDDKILFELYYEKHPVMNVTATLEDNKVKEMK